MRALFLLHGGQPHNWHDLIRAWSFEPLIVMSLAVSALLFWWALIHGPQGAIGYGAAVLYLFATSVHSGILGALITIDTSTNKVIGTVKAGDGPWGIAL